MTTMAIMVILAMGCEIIATGVRSIVDNDDLLAMFLVAIVEKVDNCEVCRTFGYFCPYYPNYDRFEVYFQIIS